jgi:hypothetical protein
MKITKDDPRLTAFALGELPERECAAMEVALARNPQLTRVVEEVGGFGALITESLGSSKLTLGEDRYGEIFKAGKRPDADVIVLKNRRKLRSQSFLAISGVAAVVTLGFYLLSKTVVDAPGDLADHDSGAGDSQVAGGNDGDPGPADISAIPPEITSGLPRFAAKKVMASELSALPLPLNVGRVDLLNYERSLSAGIPKAVKIEEWINAGTGAFEPMVKVAGVGMAAELGDCPWDATKHLLLIQVADLKPGGSAPILKGNLVLEPNRVISTRLLASAILEEEGAEESIFKSDSSIALLYELELSPGEGRVAGIDLEIVSRGDDSKNSYLPILGKSESPSLHFETAVTMARFAKVLNEGVRDQEWEEISWQASALLKKVSDSQTRYALDLILLTAERIKM